MPTEADTWAEITSSLRLLLWGQAITLAVLVAVLLRLCVWQ